MRSHQALAIENLALRQQLVVYKYRHPRPRLTDADLERRGLLIVDPEHRQLDFELGSSLDHLQAASIAYRIDIGMIAEDVGKVIPEVVVYEENGIDAQSVDYARLTVVLVEAVKIQQEQIEQLASRIAEMEFQLSSTR